MNPQILAAAIKAGKPFLKVTVAVVVTGLVVGTLTLVLMSGGGVAATASRTAVGACSTSRAGSIVVVPVVITAAGAQARNTATIASVGRGMGVSDAGLVIALGTALVESGLRNLASLAVPESVSFPNDGAAPGDHDSVGIFQQRASWGSVQERMDPATSARLFFERLLGVPGWEQMAPGVVAQTVQVSARPDAYAPRMSEAAGLLGSFGGSGVVNVSAGGGVACPSAAVNVAAAGGGGAASGFVDGPGQGLPRANPRTVDQAIAWARAEAASGNSGWYRRCLAFVAIAYGWSFSGINYAIDKYSDVPPDMRHTDRNPPPGALLFWDTGSRAGHVALYLGGGEIASNDIRVNGQISVVPASAPETEWHARYLGWTPGFFPHGG